MDSRAYRFIFPVNTPAEIPDDFRASVQGRSFETGVFLPQEDVNWFTRPPEYPARLLLLNGCFVSIIPHPTSGQPTVELNLGELVQLEMGSSLLRGWIRFDTPFSTDQLNYNTRASRPVDEFLAVVRRRWLGEPPATNSTCPKMFGQELDIKFENLLHDALDRNERVLSQCFIAPIEYRDKLLIFSFRGVKWRPGHLVVLTSGNRILWLKDAYRRRRERYAGIAVSAPTPLFRGSILERHPDHDKLIINFVSGTSWWISIYETDCDCAGFSRTLNSCIAPELSKDQERISIQ